MIVSINSLAQLKYFCGVNTGNPYVAKNNFTRQNVTPLGV